MYATDSYSYTHLILVLGIVRAPTVWVFRTSQYPGIHDISLASSSRDIVVFSASTLLPGRPHARGSLSRGAGEGRESRSHKVPAAATTPVVPNVLFLGGSIELFTFIVRLIHVLRNRPRNREIEP